MAEQTTLTEGNPTTKPSLVRLTDFANQKIEIVKVSILPSKKDPYKFIGIATIKILGAEEKMIDGVYIMHASVLSQIIRGRRIGKVWVKDRENVFLSSRD